ncbi:transketolase [Phycicoccus sonneratiae]|uniref:Transketolase n=1 Tax=Phycicoccus sonneratiae TaxID=2807628 RepID=A0ABS2CIZ8_9MICO|nr:transketolase [Phycicoccus sonneraticus]MBM6399839.1 transketolase [Phycicoccus sonneraticus]
MRTATTAAPRPALPVSQRERFYAVVGELLADDPRLALVLADIGLGYLPELPESAARRVVNVGIREQLLVGAAAGLAMAGLRPIAHSFPPFLVERPFEQLKLDLCHQDVGALLVSAGGSYGWPGGGETHFGMRDVSLLDTLDDVVVDVPGHADEAEALLRQGASADDRRYLRLDDHDNATAHDVTDGRLVPVRTTGSAATVVAVGPVLDRVLRATEGLDVSVAYTARPRPFDTEGLRAATARTSAALVVVEPYLAGTSAHVLSHALRHRPHRLLSLGVGRAATRTYGSVEDHDRLHRLDPAGLREDIAAFLAA